MHGGIRASVCGKTAVMRVSILTGFAMVARLEKVSPMSFHIRASQDHSQP
jgi:hypothetical protein